MCGSCPASAQPACQPSAALSSAESPVDKTHRIYKQQINTTNRNSMNAITMGPYKMSLFYSTTICCCFLSARSWYQCGPLSWRPTWTTKQSQGTTYNGRETKYGPCISRHDISLTSQLQNQASGKVRLSLRTWNVINLKFIFFLYLSLIYIVSVHKFAPDTRSLIQF